MKNLINGFFTLGSFLLLFSLTFAQSSIKSNSDSLSNNFGVLTGRVGTLVHPKADIQLVIKGTKVSKKVKTDSSGKYKISLPSGIYTIQSQEGEKYFSYKRAPIFVSSNKVTTININLPQKIGNIKYTEVTQEDGFIDKYELKERPKYRSFYPVGCSKTQTMLLQYRRMKKLEKSILYEDVSVTYKGYTIEAIFAKLAENKIIFSPNGDAENVHVTIDKKEVEVRKVVLTYESKINLNITTIKDWTGSGSPIMGETIEINEKCVS